MNITIVLKLYNQISQTQIFKMTESENVLNWFNKPQVISKRENIYETIFYIQKPTEKIMGKQVSFFLREDRNGKVS